ncbi:DUF5655 domain-containing protein [Companilactobacillus mishanensis]|uniref:DUF5655 domain-containing protein n=1 Tax=Companilactobacillus mishanensis TaxID=2486008 RepID=UPI0012955A6E|nr:DUF5655 domain-containing protein [Companilactobacillus mishanensis]MQS89779.1 transporter [Companilactobacillus mishanensis]
MELYNISNSNLKRVNSSNFKVERELQELIENNLENIMGIQFVASEFTIENYRLDTVAYDEENNSFVIIEYKRSSKESVIDQGFAYLNTTLRHKADFTLAYNQKFESSYSIQDFDWTSTRIIFIAGTFTTYQKDAVNNPDLPVELYEAKLFDGNLLSLNPIIKTNIITKTNRSSSSKETSKKISTVETINELAPPTESALLSSSSEEVITLYDQFKSAILEWDSDFEIKPTKIYIGFRLNHSNVVDFTPQQKKLKIWINMEFGKLNDPLHLFRDVSNIGHWGNGPYETSLSNDNQIEYVLSLIKQSWEIHRNQ